ncbi:hypothetical protein EVAR_99071_1 [Eumeta japonica]|uniref:Uncharacterized protein n=1 Tax=Eumeta variegata TaxID=151549 RepID=A0A4C1TC62_EUMVA|nr:hypothetical protein EVAR_99071_1 [Eumeta japonica]
MKDALATPKCVFNNQRSHIIDIYTVQCRYRSNRILQLYGLGHPSQVEYRSREAGSIGARRRGAEGGGVRLQRVNGRTSIPPHGPPAPPAPPPYVTAETLKYLTSVILMAPRPAPAAGLTTLTISIGFTPSGGTRRRRPGVAQAEFTDPGRERGDPAPPGSRRRNACTHTKA